MELTGKRVVVVGLGASGVAAARLCLRRGAAVTATDVKPRSRLDAAALALEESGARLRVGGHEAAGLREADLVVVSPGVPAFPELSAASGAGVPIVSEVELAVGALRHPAPIVAVGGTNGKSTTTSLVGAMLEADGGRAFVGGNLGEPLSDHADEAFDTIVLEVSSFQLERVHAFHPRVAVLLNVTADHLDRYASFEEYAKAKGNAFVRQTAVDAAVVPVDDPLCLRQARRGDGRVVTFGAGGTVRVGAEALTDTRSGAVFPLSRMLISGGHNATNAAAAIAAAGDIGVTAGAMAQALSTFRGLPHRMALAGEIAGVRFYDDSKGTNVGAAVTALLGLREPRVVLIAGGRDKGGSYAPLADALRRKGRAAVLVGEAAEAIETAVRAEVPTHRAATIEEAVRVGARLAVPGDAVLLSPACSSYDMFKDYKERGDAFVREVLRLSTPGQET